MNHDLYELPQGWEWKKLGDILHIERGGSPRPIDDYITKESNGINWIKIGDTKNSTKYIYTTAEKIKPEGLKKTRMVYEGDFILSNSMSFGRPYIMKTTGCIHDGWLLLRPISDNIDREYLYYVLSSDAVYRQFSLKASGTTVKNLNSNLVKDVNIPLPPLEEQKRIVAKLDALFQRIDQAIALLETNITHTEAIMPSALDEVYLELQSKYDTQEIAKLLKIKSGEFLPKKNMEENGEIEVYGGNGIMGTHNEYNLSGENIIIGRVGALCGNVRLIYGDIWLTDNAFYISEMTQDFKKAYLKYILHYLDLGSTANQAAQPVISFKGISHLPIPLPPLEVQNQVVTYLDALSEQVEALKATQQAKLANLKALKSSLLDQAFRGEL